MRAAMREFGVRETEQIAAFLTELGPALVIGLVSHNSSASSLVGGTLSVQVWYWTTTKRRKQRVTA